MQTPPFEREGRERRGRGGFKGRFQGQACPSKSRTTKKKTKKTHIHLEYPNPPLRTLRKHFGEPSESPLPRRHPTVCVWEEGGESKSGEEGGGNQGRMTVLGQKNRNGTSFRDKMKSDTRDTKKTIGTRSKID